MQFRTWLESSGLDALLSGIREKYPEVKVEAYETGHKIELMQIRVPEDMRGGGIGTEIIKTIQDHARSVGKPIVLRPEADRGRKGDLDRFYRGLGFVRNSGRNKDFSLSSPTASTMYWRPDIKESYMGSHRPPGRHYGAPLHDLTELYPDDVYEDIFQYMSDGSQREAAAKVLRYRNKPDDMVEIYRAVPRGVANINPGDWVSMTRGYAQLHARHPNDPKQDMGVISAMVRAGDLYNDGNSMEEWGYWGKTVDTDSQKVSECMVEARTPKVIMYHGSAFRNLRSIMSHGLLPNPKGRAWSADSDSGFNNASRASLEGVYLTGNLMTALSAASNGNNRQHMEDGDLLIAVEMQPKTAFADEDDLNFLSVVSDHSYVVASLYDSWKKGISPEFLEDHMRKYKERALSRLANRTEVNPKLRDRLWEMLDRVFFAALERQAAYVADTIKRNFKDLAPPNKGGAEEKYMRVREGITRTMKSLANPFRYSSDPFSLTGRVVEPIGFRGTNKIVCVLHVPFDYKQKPRLIYGEIPEDLITQWEQRKGEWKGVEK